MAMLKVTNRTATGSKNMRRLRAEGLIPGIIYGHGEGSQAVTLHTHEVELALQHGERVLDLDVEGKEQNVLIKEVQWDTFGQDILHVDLTRVDLNEIVQVAVPVILKGHIESPDGVLSQPFESINVECAVRDIPDNVTANVSGMVTGDVMNMGDLKLPKGVTLLDDPETTIASVTYVEEVEEETEEEAGLEMTEPEVIGEKPEEGEEGEEEPQD
ncbi:MAG: 50S ribosomal protein L25 [Phycisphaerae bacterium]